MENKPGGEINPVSGRHPDLGHRQVEAHDGVAGAIARAAGGAVGSHKNNTPPGRQVYQPPWTLAEVNSHPRPRPS